MLRVRKFGSLGHFSAIVTALLLTCVGAPARAQDAPAASTSDYTKRVVAYIGGGKEITRYELGEYLIARLGADKLELLVNRRIIEKACRAKGIEVTGSEVEASLAQDLKGLNIDRARFVRDVLKSYRKNLYEWKEDVVRPKLLLSKLCRKSVTASDAEINEAFDARYGEKIDCRIILWPKSQEEQAKTEFSALRDSEDAFAAKAKSQPRGPLAAVEGRIKPVARGSLNAPEIERAIFALKPGEVSRLLPSPPPDDGVIIVKCDRRLPADTTVSLEKVRPDLEREVIEKKLLKEIPAIFAELKKEAAPKLLLPTPGSKDDTPESRQPGAAVARLADGELITREHLGEFLIARYGVEKLDLLVNRRILDAACQEKNLTCSEAEIEVELEVHLRRLKVDRKIFAEQVLKPQRVTLHEWREDVARTKVLMEKLCRANVKVTEDDIQKAFNAYYGEKVKLRLILWPKGEERAAMLDYPKIRDSEKDFAHKARTQADARLASNGGKLPPLGRNTTGNEDLEKEAFSLEPGEVSRLIGTPQGTVVVKCDGRDPANTTVKLEAERDKLVQEVIERKLPFEMQKAFQEMREAAKPRLLIVDPNSVEDLKAQVEPELKQVNDERPPPPSK